ncbi:MAG TPA: M61 family peptidase [Rhodanobacteraceae bacterium]|nr:M61 family peptidase [Rhodanobacteraceae bacterium]
MKQGMKRSAWLLGTCVFGASLSCAAHAGVEVPAAAPAKKPGGVIELTVRLPNPAQKLLYVHEVIPVKPGRVTLYYPKWIPGDHSPDGPINAIMGLEVTAAGKRIAWHRDELDRFTFHMMVPQGAHRIEVRFQFPSSRRVTPNLVDLTWDHVALYRAGYPTRTQLFQPTLVIPADWQYASALETQNRDGKRITFKPVPFNTLVDSPVIAGRHFRKVNVTPPGASVKRHLDLVGDSDAAVAISDKQIAGYRHLVRQAQALFGSHHYDAYHFLLTLSDHTSVGGLEHHRSSDDRARGGAKTFADADHFMMDASLLPHEYVHSWNGKFMRPAGLWQPDFEKPERPKMLWVYEGLTVYLGDVLTVRSGLWSSDVWRQVVAYRAAVMAHRTGREWRPLIDTTIAVNYGAPSAGANWRRQNDFYREGQLLWMAVDMKIRTLSHGKHAIDDFARAFFGVDNGSFVTHTYTFDDVVAALDKVQPYDWASFLKTWVNGTGDEVPLLSGITASGWKLVYTDKPSRYESALENVGMGELEGMGFNEMFSIGLFLRNGGAIADVRWNGPAFKAGLAPGMRIVAVDGKAYSIEALRDRIARAQQDKQPIHIRAKGDGVTRRYMIHYDGGLKYPHLVRAPGTTDYLKQILAPRPIDNGS